MQQYGGLCSRPIYLRFAEHLEDIKSGNTSCPIGKHWQLPGHTLEHLELILVEKVGARDRLTLRIREGDQDMSSPGLSQPLQIKKNWGFRFKVGNFAYCH